MKKSIFRTTTVLLAVVLLASCVLCGCGSPKGTTLNGIDLKEFTIIYDENQPDYVLRAANYIQTQISARTGIELTVAEASSGTFEHVIAVGECPQVTAQALDAQLDGVQIAFLADENHIAMDGNYFAIAAAAYYFVENYIPGKAFNSKIDKELKICDPITEKPQNYILLIGDGMGPNHTRIFEKMDVTEEDISDGEDLFYGYLLPNQGLISTYSYSGTTDSAAAATALATGYKTYNGYVGLNADGDPVQSLTELAGSKSMATAVMSTESRKGATPSGFSAHAKDRGDDEDIAKTQVELVQAYGTLIECGTYNVDDNALDQTLATLGQNKKGFFLMYEEAHIDKFSHSNDLDGMWQRVLNFNQAIGRFMEYAFYHPNTVVLITADHETGGLSEDFVYHTENHTPVDVQIFAYGQGTEYFNEVTRDNIDIPKFIASCWGVKEFGQQ